MAIQTAKSTQWRSVGYQLSAQPWNTVGGWMYRELRLFQLTVIASLSAQYITIKLRHSDDAVRTHGRSGNLPTAFSTLSTAR